MAYKPILSFGKHKIDLIDFLRFLIREHGKEFDRLLVKYIWYKKEESNNENR